MDLDDVRILETIARTRMALRVSMAVSSSLLLHDLAITWSDEVSMVWQRPWSGAKVTFFLNRYLCFLLCVLYTTFLFFTNDSFEKCKLSFAIQAWGGWLSVALVQLLLLSWVIAVYRLSEWFMAIVVIPYLALLCSSTTGMFMSLPTMLNDIATPTCLPIRTVDEAVFAVKIWKERLPSLWEAMLASALPSCAFQLLLLIALLCRSIKFYKDTRVLFAEAELNTRSFRRNQVQTQTNAQSNGRTRTAGDSIGGTLLNCSILYFTGSLIVYAQNFLIWLLAPPQFFSIGIGLSIALPSLLGARLLIDLRTADRRQLNCRSTAGAARNTNTIGGGRALDGRHGLEGAQTLSLSFMVLGVGSDVLDSSVDTDSVDHGEIWGVGSEGSFEMEES